jgi:cellulose synthase/poly-beta-1,6-N-acetylglucosamine synthase-like glycosyltransferase
MTTLSTEAALEEAINGLRNSNPSASAATTFLPWQRNTLLTLTAAAVAGLVFATRVAVVVLCLIVTLLYLWTLLDRLVVFYRGLDADAILTVSDQEARSIPDDELPVYTVLVPAYHEPEVVSQLMTSMAALDYPPAKLDVLLLLEADDEITIAAAERAGISGSIRVVLVPAADPRTKPKACNYGLLLAHGDLTTIYDAEDHPEPLQLRRVVAALRRLPANVACVQAKLAFHNGRQNLLTAWFTTEYGLWFGYLLPGLMRTHSPIPLGGTSNHIRTSVLRELGAWDPFNVTEDADLGMRIAIAGYTTAVLDSTTVEEANSDPINWIRQRSRWYKGYLQTWLVHTRHPVRTWRSLGTVQFMRMNLILAGTPLTACLNLVFWFATLAWIFGQPQVVADAFPPFTYYIALICLLFGNASTLFCNLIGARASGNSNLLLACLTVPLYWVLMGVAATKGCWQLIRNPAYWEKTFHGLDVAQGPEDAK